MTGSARRAPAESLVEFALVISAFTLLMLGVFDWARVFATYISMANATREAARQAQVTSSTVHPLTLSATTDLQSIVNQALNSYTLQLGPGQFVSQDVCLFDPGTVLTSSTIATCTAATDDGSESKGASAVLIVRSTYSVQFLPLMSTIVPTGLTFSTSAVAYLE